MLFWTSRSFYEDCQSSLELWHICGVILEPVPGAVHFPVEGPALTFLKWEKKTISELLKCISRIPLNYGLHYQ